MYLASSGPIWALWLSSVHLVPTMPATAPIIGYLCIALAAALWGSLGVVSRQVLAAGVGPLELSVWRAAIAGALFAVHAVARGKVHVARADYPVLGIFAVTGVSIFYL